MGVELFAARGHRDGAAATLDAWYGVTAYAFQIYFDFSGYTDMARGIGRLIGLRLMLNFNNPYLATGLGDFWRRWHISLSTWFRDYVYIPLGGNRKGAARRYLNLMVTMLLGGLWHGAAWTFVLWGAFHGALLAVERMRGKGGLLAAWPRPVPAGAVPHRRAAARADPARRRSGEPAPRARSGGPPAREPGLLIC